MLSYTTHCLRHGEAPGRPPDITSDQSMAMVAMSTASRYCTASSQQMSAVKIRSLLPISSSSTIRPMHSTDRSGTSATQRCLFSTSPQRRTDAGVQDQPTPPKLTWDDFLKLRKRRRYVNLAASVGTAAGSVTVFTPLAMQYEVENQIAAVTGMDPFIAFGLAITAVGGFGWLMGPFVGNSAFGLYNRSIRTEIAKVSRPRGGLFRPPKSLGEEADWLGDLQKEREFYEHIKRSRADPTSSSVNNPVPDYYGEKITSVADYRRWLKDQRAFNRKKSKNLI